MAENLTYAVLETLNYFDIFDFPLKFDELQERLIFSNTTDGKYLKKALNELTEKKIISCKKDVYFLAGREKLLEVKEKIDERFTGASRQVAKRKKFFKLVPSLKAVALIKDYDLVQKEIKPRLLVITSKNRLFITRVILNLFWRNKFDYSFFLAEPDLELNEKNLSVAYQILEAKLLLNRDRVFNKFLLANSWLKSFLLNSPTSETKTKKRKELEEGNLWVGLGDILEGTARFFNSSRVSLKKEKNLWVLQEMTRRLRDLNYSS